MEFIVKLNTQRQPKTPKAPKTPHFSVVFFPSARGDLACMSRAWLDRQQLRNDSQKRQKRHKRHIFDPVFSLSARGTRARG